VKTVAGRWPNSGRYRWKTPRLGTADAADACLIRVSARSRKLLSGPFLIGFPAIHAFSQSGRTGETITVSGSFFGERTGKIYLGNARAAIPRGGWTDTSVQAVIPEGALTGPVTLVTWAGNQTGTAGPVIILPRITSLAPDSAHADQTVVIHGSGFGARQGSGQVTIGGTAAAVVAWSNLRITARVPAGATSGKVRVVNDAGDSSESPGDFTVLP
jgi:hypothetical protein